MQHDFILLDRSGSMQNLWSEAINSVNTYVKKLADDNVDTGVTLAVFDTGPDGKLDFTILRDRIIPSTWRAVSALEVVPRNSTPLNDATGRIVSLARAGNYDKCAIIIMTDGQENASRELTVAQVKSLLDECRAKGWQVIFLGANFDNASQSASYGGLRGQTVQISPQNFTASASLMAEKRSAYSVGLAQSMDWTDEEKEDLKTDKAS